MRNKYLNRNFRIFKQTKIGFKTSRERADFEAKMFTKFIGLKHDEFWEIFALNIHEACRHIMERDYNILFVDGDNRYVVIGKEEKELLNFFLDNAPLDNYKERKRLNYLWCYGQHREMFNEDFDLNISVYYTPNFKEKLKKIETRENSLSELLDI